MGNSRPIALVGQLGDKGQIAKGLAIGPIAFGDSGRLPGDWQIGPIALGLIGRLPKVWQPGWSYGEQ